MSSPWGTIQDSRSICRGVAWVSTPGHGGLRIAKGFAEKHLSEAARKRAIVQGGYLYYEEDCDFAIPLFELPHLWDSALRNTPSNERQDMLMNSLSGWNPEYLLERNIEPYEKPYSEWKKRRERDVRHAAKDPDLITAAQRVNDSVTKVWTADGKQHYVSAESYTRNQKQNMWLNLLSQCDIVPSPEA